MRIVLHTIIISLIMSLAFYFSSSLRFKCHLLNFQRKFIFKNRITTKNSHKKDSFRKQLRLFDSNNDVDDSNIAEKSLKKSKKFIEFPFKYHEELTIKIDDITNLGVGVGRTILPDGSKWVIFVPLVLPGEEVKVRIYRNNPTYSEADIVEIIKQSDSRVIPQCKYFTICGGCQYQHMNIDSQRFWKKSQVIDLLTRIGGLTDLVVNDVVGTNNLYNYRSKLTPHYNYPSSPSELKIGFQQRGTRNIIDIDSCIIATNGINQKYIEVRNNLKNNLVTNVKKRGATLLFRESDDNYIETNNNNLVNQTVCGVKFTFKAGEFFQNNHFVIPLMVEHVISKAIGDNCYYMIDAYCGSGLFSLCASKHFKSVHGVEVSELAIEAAKENAKQNNINNSEFYNGLSEAIFDKVKHLNEEETVIVLDPPRKGCDNEFLQQLFAFHPKKIVYVSCDPATQARDTKQIVSAGYRIVDITPFDLFPQTRHIENVITFVTV